MELFQTQLLVLEDHHLIDSLSELGFVSIPKRKHFICQLFTIFGTVQEFYNNQGGKKVTPVAGRAFHPPSVTSNLVHPK